MQHKNNANQSIERKANIYRVLPLCNWKMSGTEISKKGEGYRLIITRHLRNGVHHEFVEHTQSNIKYSTGRYAVEAGKTIFFSSNSHIVSFATPYADALCTTSKDLRKSSASYGYRERDIDISAIAAQVFNHDNESIIAPAATVPVFRNGMPSTPETINLIQETLAAISAQRPDSGLPSYGEYQRYENHDRSISPDISEECQLEEDHLTKII